MVFTIYKYKCGWKVIKEYVSGYCEIIYDALDKFDAIRYCDAHHLQFVIR
jgi:hypothetical protein